MVNLGHGSQSVLIVVGQDQEPSLFHLTTVIRDQTVMHGAGSELPIVAPGAKHAAPDMGQHRPPNDEAHLGASGNALQGSQKIRT